jgi:hypothetical protein
VHDLVSVSSVPKDANLKNLVTTVAASGQK